MNATRERQVEFLMSFGCDTLEKAVVSMIRKNGADWLTAGQMAEIVSTEVTLQRFHQRVKRHNRRTVSYPGMESSWQRLSAADRADAEYQQSREEWNEAAE